jgi:AmmeMemoRadiSam system protein B
MVAQEPTSRIRPPAVAGSFYPRGQAELAAMVEALMARASTSGESGLLVGLIAPHAGYMYSGPVAASVFARLGSQVRLFERVLLIGPSHYVRVDGIAAPSSQTFATPLGEIELDRAAIAALLDAGLVTIDDRAHAPEHSLEIELPFLQRSIEPGFKLLPLMVRDQGHKVTRILGQCLAKTMRGRNALLVASTDLSHFYPQDVANQLDAEMLRAIESFDPDLVIQTEEQGKGFACGRGALASVLWAAKDMGADHIKILNHATSGDVTGDTGQVVGYGAAVVLQQSQGV